VLLDVEQKRLDILADIDPVRKSHLGQFFTPAATAKFMASLFNPVTSEHCSLLDAGAGIGSLCSAFLDECVSGRLTFDSIKVTAFEIDDSFRKMLYNTLYAYIGILSMKSETVSGDFVEKALDLIQFSPTTRFTHCILNPPYKKIRSGSRHHSLLKCTHIDTGNLYSAFLALALELMAPGGQLVAIIPRSFCNGPYYRAFRQFILERSALRRIHLFDSRDKAFSDDDVLQENVIVMLERDAQQTDVTISTSSDDRFDDLTVHDYPWHRIMWPNDEEQFIRIPTSERPGIIESSPEIRYTLEQLGIDVSTGPVVDFRLRNHLRQLPEPGTVPLIYPAHLSGGYATWPMVSARKPNAICRNTETVKYLYPNGFYCVVRRFSSKEEHRRIVPTVIDPNTFASAEMIGFENHLNVFHKDKRGLPEALARGLAVYLATTAVDKHFRQFSGHTQVNATDLRTMRYLGRQQLVALGNWAIRNPQITQEMIDARLLELAHP
jgi:adenine-specific DNA-methyltransferase